MDRTQLLKVLLPAASAGVLVLFIGLLITSNNQNGPPGSGEKSKDKNSSKISIPPDAEGMSDSLPPADGDEWQPLADGIKYWDVVEGEGDECKPGAKVKIHYTGWLLNGKVFDSSVSRGKTIEFSLDGLIPGWQKGIPGMKPGGIRRLYIPYDQAYGERGTPDGNIPPKSDLIFEVKLFKAS